MEIDTLMTLNYVFVFIVQFNISVYCYYKSYKTTKRPYGDAGYLHLKLKTNTNFSVWLN
jgi:hypothetical protein